MRHFHYRIPEPTSLRKNLMANSAKTINCEDLSDSATTYQPTKVCRAPEESLDGKANPIGKRGTPQEVSMGPKNDDKWYPNAKRLT